MCLLLILSLPFSFCYCLCGMSFLFHLLPVVCVLNQCFFFFLIFKICVVNLCLLIGVFSPITLSIICPFPRAGHSNWGSLLHTHNTTIKIRKLTYIYYCHLIFKPQSNLASCPSNTLYIEQRMHCRTSCCLSFSCLFSLEQFLSFSLISMTLT